MHKKIRTASAAVVLAASGAVYLLGSASSAFALGVTVPTEEVAPISGGPCVITAGDQVTLTPSFSLTFGKGSGVYESCPS